MTRTISASYQTTYPERALFWNSRNADASLELARRQIAKKGAPSPTKAEFDAAKDLTQRSLRLNPVAPGALTILARITEGEGQAPKAAALMRLAGQRALRDPIAQTWLLNYELDRRDFDAALPHLDAILRTQFGSVDPILPVLGAFVSSRRSVQAFANLVGTAPPWRAWFFSHIGPYVPDHAALARFYADLEKSPNPPSQQEFQPYLDLLVKKGLFKDAYAAWIETLPLRRRADASTLYNGAFRYPLSGSEFDWQTLQSLGADIEVLDARESGILRVEFSGARVDFQNVSHLLVLAPGPYRLTGEVEARSLHTERGLWWRVFCVGQPDASLGESELVAESASWHHFALSFNVPPNGCPAQVLRLELPARVSLEKIISGVVSYRNLVLAPANAKQTTFDH